ncbi:MAG: AbiU2 domain-containing protein [Methyloceanibacter sp.]
MAKDATEDSKRSYTAQESRERYIAKMGEALGTQFAALWQEVAHLHMSWSEYVELFGTKPSRIDLLNSAAPRFFRILQDALWDETLLHIARLTDSPESGKGKSNLTIRNLPELVDEPAAKNPSVSWLKLQ